MSLRMTRGKSERIEWERRRLAKERAHRVALRDARAATKVISLWNCRLELNRAPLFYPTIGGAILSGHIWLLYLCPACKLISEVDIRTFDRHPRAAIDCLIPELSCRACCPNAPHAKLVGLSAKPAGGTY